ncbi:hypothetical protein BWR19_01805 [Halomonas sp. 1513]|nr:DUF262 domain-containing protein [Halomonas sp. 1513]APX91775.1 hypothetical protein BWR19_01805 [Halomonas sp. 1513]
MRSSATDNQVIQSLTSLAALFPGRYFRVPDYQRGYAWEASQVKALLDDLEVLESSKSSGLHYTGTLVLVPSSDHADEYPVFDIVDGQQRLTTLTMLMNALVAIVEERAGLACGESDLHQLYLDRGSRLKGYQPALMLNKDIEEFFRALLKGETEKETIEYLSQKRLLEAYNQIVDWTRRKASCEDEARDWLDIVTTRLGMIAYQPQNAEEAGMMFEVINNRGKPLTELEKVKNYLIYYAIKKQYRGLQDTINAQWGRVLRNLALAHHMSDIDNQQLLRSAVIVYFGFRKHESNAAYNKLKSVFSLKNGGSAGATKLDEFVVFLSDCSRYYELLFNQNSQHRSAFFGGKTALADVVDLIRVQTAHSGVLPLFLCSMWMFDKKKITAVHLLDLLEAIERVNFRVYMLPVGGARSDSGHGQLFNIAHTFYDRVANTTNFDAIDDAVKSCNESLIGFVKSYGHKTLEAFKDSFRLKESDQNMDFASWRGLRYFLANYEQTLDPTRTSSIDLQLKANKASRHNDYAQIEHIYARHCSFTGPDSIQASHQKRRLGNLMLLEWGVNASFSNKPIEEKLKHLKENDIAAKRAVLAQTAAVINDFNKVFGEASKPVSSDVQDAQRFNKYVLLIDRIEDRLISFAGKRWSFEPEMEDSSGIESD